jgi:tetratricopeptide (TPR) repeat protein
MTQFFTTSDLIHQINTSLEEIRGTNNEEAESQKSQNDTPKFELQRRFPDGTTRKASPEETAAADAQAKLQQASQIVSQLNCDEKLQWATEQRQVGNQLFQEGKYKEAMDVYLTCLVALEYTSKDHDSQDDVQMKSIDEMDKDIKMPVLLNLAACALSLGMYKKTVSFCDFCMELNCAKKNAKVYFRRGKAHMCMGNYTLARNDLNIAQSIISEEFDVYSKEYISIQKEMHRLDQMMKNSKRNKERQAKAMKKWMGGDGDKKQAMSSKDKKNVVSFGILENRYFVFYIKMVERGLRKLLYWLGEEDAMNRSYLDDDKSRKDK